jgi:hypothetical protein
MKRNPPAPAKRARVFKMQTRYGPCWFGLRIGATRPLVCNSWEEAFGFATDFKDHGTFYKEQGLRPRYYIEVRAV